MKKINYLIIILTALRFSVFSQESKMQFGLNIAPSFSSLRGNNNIENFDSKASISANLTLDYFFNENLILLTGLGYENKGAKLEVFNTNSIGESAGSFESTLKFNYLNLPIMLGYSTKGKTKYYIGAGGFLSLLLKQETNSKGFNVITDSNVDITIDNTDDYNNLDWGLSFILGVKIPINDKLNLDFSIRDLLGLSNISSLEIINNGTIETNSLAIQLGLKYNL